MEDLQNRLFDFCACLGIDQIAVTSVAPLGQIKSILGNAVTPFCQNQSIESRIEVNHNYPWAKTAIVFLLPYDNKKNEESNISKYAYGRDYHKVAQEISGEIIKFLMDNHNDAQTVAFCDTTSLCQRALAHRAGLGFYGENHCLINEKYGSYFFICHVLTNIDFDTKEVLDGINDGFACQKCGKCKTTCPTGVLKQDNPDFSHCLSSITQRKGPLSEAEQMLIKTISVWGCDQCQKVCPHNLCAEKTPFEERFSPYIYNLTNEVIENGIADRSYSWRPKSLLKRNLKHLM